MLSGTLGDILGTLSNTLSTYPRRVPGVLQLEGRPFHYVDLHSFYHQGVQIFGHHLYDFTSAIPNPLILDCGAHIGMASLYFASRNPAAKIIAFEADPQIAEALKRNVEAFGLANVSVEPKAVWISNDGVRFSIESDDSGFVKDEGTLVPSVRLKDILTVNRVELLKVDIEGAEYALFRDCANALGNVQKIIIEAHQLRREGSLAELLTILESSGFRYVLSDLHQAVWMPNENKPPFSETKTEKYLVSIFAWRE